MNVFTVNMAIRVILWHYVLLFKSGLETLHIQSSGQIIAHSLPTYCKFVLFFFREKPQLTIFYCNCTLAIFNYFDAIII